MPPRTENSQAASITARFPFEIAPPFLMTPAPTSRAQGISILELLLVVSILAILAALIIPAYGFFRRKAEDGVRMSNLRSLHAGFSAYLHDHAFVWPQNPYLGGPSNDNQDSDEAKWWFEQLKDHGPTRETWLCPSERGHWADNNDPEFFNSTYVPSNFDETPNIAYRWPRQPWVIERGGFHEKGQANAVFPDGHIDKNIIPGMGDFKAK